MTPTRWAVAWTVAIFVACSIPGAQVQPPELLPFAVDKWVHVGMFVGFGALWTWARPDRVWEVLVAGIAFGIGIEIWQGLLPIDRFPEALDAVADVVGLGLGIGLAVVLRRRSAGNE